MFWHSLRIRRNVDRQDNRFKIVKLLFNRDIGTENVKLLFNRDNDTEIRPTRTCSMGWE